MVCKNMCLRFDFFIFSKVSKFKSLFQFPKSKAQIGEAERRWQIKFGELVT